MERIRPIAQCHAGLAADVCRHARYVRYVRVPTSLFYARNLAASGFRCPHVRRGRLLAGRLSRHSYDAERFGNIQQPSIGGPRIGRALVAACFADKPPGQCPLGTEPYTALQWTVMGRTAVHPWDLEAVHYTGCMAPGTISWSSCSFLSPVCCRCCQDALAAAWLYRFISKMNSWGAVLAVG